MKLAQLLERVGGGIIHTGDFQLSHPIKVALLNLNLISHLVRGIVEYPDDVRVDSRGLRRGRVLEVRVHPDDLGKVIGRGGRTARALRTVIGSLAGNAYVRVDLLDTDEIR